jgi:hypothetical protein
MIPGPIGRAGMLLSATIPGHIGMTGMLLSATKNRKISHPVLAAKTSKLLLVLIISLIF